MIGQPTTEAPAAKAVKVITDEEVAAAAKKERAIHDLVTGPGWKACFEPFINERLAALAARILDEITLTGDDLQGIRHEYRALKAILADLGAQHAECRRVVETYREQVAASASPEFKASGAPPAYEAPKLVPLTVESLLQAAAQDFNPFAPPKS